LIHIADATKDPEIWPLLIANNASSYAAIPLMRDGKAVGAISMNSPVAGGFSETHIMLLRTFAEQAVIAITSAETYRDLQARTTALARRNSEYGERIEQQAATIDVLKAMSASPGNTQPVIDLITRRAAELCGSRAALYELRGGQIHMVSNCGTDPDLLAAFRRNFPRPPDRSLVVDRAILDRQVIHVPEVAADPMLSQATRDLGGTAVVGIPLLRDGDPIGAIALNGRHSGGFSKSQIELLKAFAEQAVIAITSAETYRALQARTTDLQESLEYQTATSDVLKVISRSKAGARDGAAPSRPGHAGRSYRGHYGRRRLPIR
jgi:two-component system, NtrC family, sensor kinase